MTDTWMLFCFCSICWKIIGLDFDQELCFISPQSLALLSPIPKDKVQLIVKGGELWWFIWFLDFFFGVQLFIYSEHCCLRVGLDLFLLMLSNLRLLPTRLAGCWAGPLTPQVPVCCHLGTGHHTTSEHVDFLIIWYKGTAKAPLQAANFCSEWGAMGDPHAPETWRGVSWLAGLGAASP